MSHTSRSRSFPMLAGWIETPKSKLLLIVVAVFLTAYAAIEFTRQTGRVAIIWPPDAIMLAFLLRGQRTQWVPMLIAGFIGNWAADWLAADPMGTAFLLAACNTIELVVSIVLFSRFADMPADLTRPATFFKFLLFCGLLGPAASAIAGSAVMTTMTDADPWPVFYSWFASDSLGVLTIAPLLLMLRSGEWAYITSKAMRAQTFRILGLVGAAALATFAQDRYPLLFLVFPFLILAAFHLRFAGATLAMALVALTAIPLTMLGHGPLALVTSMTIGERVVLLQVFLATGVFTILPIAAVLTGRHRLERETVAARRAAERANAAKSAFLTNMSHELRTPMTGIMGMCDLLLASHQPPEQRAITETLERSTRSFLELLNDLLDLAKIEAGRMDLDTTDFRVSQVMRDVQEFFAPAMRQKGLVFTVDFSTANTAFDVLIGDPKRLRQVLFNLVGNALKFTDRGSVAVKCRQGLQDDGTVLTEFEVRDTGIGMSRDAQGRLFRPFEQEDSSTSRRFGGTGLGLNICKHIVEAMGGKIFVQSKQGHGSAFLFSVHLIPGLAEKIEHRYAITPARTGDVLKGHKLKILFAEDNLTTQLLVRQVVEMWGHQGTLVDNGDQAVVKVQNVDFDIVLMDMQMPVMDGVAAVRAIREGDPKHAGIPIIALTADAIPESRARYLEAGCDAIVTKPIEWGHLAREIKRLIDRPLQDDLGAGEIPSAVVGAESAGSPVFDRQRIDGLGEGLGPVLLNGLLARCLESLEQYLADVVTHADGGDFTNLRRSAHDLKSTCAQFGAVRASEIARAIEVELTDADAVKAVLDELKRSVASAAQAIRAVQHELANEGQSGEGQSGRSAA